MGRTTADFLNRQGCRNTWNLQGKHELLYLLITSKHILGYGQCPRHSMRHNDYVTPSLDFSYIREKSHPYNIARLWRLCLRDQHQSKNLWAKNLHKHYELSFLVINQPILDSQYFDWANIFWLAHLPAA